jgi:hypothetical protein
MGVTIFNTAPYFSSKVVSQKVRFNSIGTYILP